MDSARPPFPIHPDVTSVLETLWQAGHGGYLVGGGVRDALLGLPVADWDVATDARPESIVRIFPGSSYQNRFGTVLARGLEITTFRRDHRYADHRRPDTITFSQDIFEDLARRDVLLHGIGTVSVSRGGDQVCRDLGMEYLGAHQLDKSYGIWDLPGAAVSSSIFGRRSPLVARAYREEFSV